MCVWMYLFRRAIKCRFDEDLLIWPTIQKHANSGILKEAWWMKFHILDILRRFFDAQEELKRFLEHYFAF